jgi:CheY-like chemotaxis protein
MDGFEASSQIKQLQIMGKLPKFSIIALSADNTEQDQIKCQESGIVEMQTKPISFDILKNKLEYYHLI